MASDINRKLKTGEDLATLYAALDDKRKQSLCDFADFLYAQAEPVKQPIPAPEEIPRPAAETVVGAVKRLKCTYPMIDSMSVFSQASALMTDHMVKGRDLDEVIDEMEILFETTYNSLLELHGQGNGQENE